MKSLRIRWKYLLFSALVWISAVSAARCATSAELQPERVKVKSGVTYTLFPQGKLRFDFVVSRPAEANKDIFLCVPAAFTTPENKIDGIYIANGAIGDARSPNQELGGALIIRNGKGQLVSTDRGKSITEDLLKSLEKSKGSLYQQFLIVHDCKPAPFRDKSEFQRRAVFETTDGKLGVVESDHAVSFNVFNADLVELGIKEALYCDMGAWDEGWYRCNPKAAVIRIGHDRSLTKRQSNWLLLKSEAATPGLLRPRSRSTVF
ncbi:MAG TPA: hypothetical protein V6C89_09860 [Drouetiella sp.]